MTSDGFASREETDPHLESAPASVSHHPGLQTLFTSCLCVTGASKLIQPLLLVQPHSRVQTLMERAHPSGLHAAGQFQVVFDSLLRKILQALAQSTFTRRQVSLFRYLSLPHQETKERPRTLEAPLLRERRTVLA